MSTYLIEDLFRAGEANLLLAIITVAFWLTGIFSLFKHKFQVAVNVAQLIWLIACLRVSIKTMGSFGCIITVEPSLAPVVYHLKYIGKALSMPFIDASLLSTVLLLPLVWKMRSQRPLQWDCLPGVLAGIGAVMVTYFTYGYVLTLHVFH